MSHPLLDQDRLLAATEPFASWIVEQRPGLELFEHEAIDVVEDVTPYALRKVRVLNGAHTALVCRAVPLELTTVAEAVAHPDLGPWLRRLLFEEVLPVLERQLPLPELEAFAESTLERFANPFLDHHLADIALHHETKVGTRLLPTHREYVERFGEPPPLLGEIVAPHL